MARVANSAPVTVGAITAQWPLIQWTTSPFGTPPNTIIQTAVSTGARGSAIFTSSNSPKYRHLGVVQPDFLTVRASPRRRWLKERSGYNWRREISAVIVPA